MNKMTVLVTIFTHSMCLSTVDTRVHYRALLLAGCPSCRPTHSVGILKAESITLNGIAHSKLTWSFSIVVLTTKGSWLVVTLGRVTKCRAVVQNIFWKAWHTPDFDL